MAAMAAAPMYACQFPVYASLLTLGPPTVFALYLPYIAIAIDPEQQLEASAYDSSDNYASAGDGETAEQILLQNSARVDTGTTPGSQFRSIARNPC